MTSLADFSRNFQPFLSSDVCFDKNYTNYLPTAAATAATSLLLLLLPGNYLLDQYLSKQSVGIDEESRFVWGFFPIPLEDIIIWILDTN
jgi:hypothetical protein